MRIPGLYGQLVAAGVGGPVALARASSVPFAIHWQAQTQWCWVALATSIGSYYASGPPCQCTLAGQFLPNDCCDLAHKASANQPRSLGLALGAVGHLSQTTYGPPSFIDVESELNAGRPLAARIRWATGSAHFVALVGCEIDAAAVEWVEIQDPLYGYTRETLASLGHRYRGNVVQWTHTYTTTP